MSEGPLVYVVDDEPAIQRSLDSLLRSVGYTVRISGSVQELYQDRELDAASCLILDVRLPFVSGLEFHEKLLDGGIDVPVIFMTGYGDIPMSVKAMKAGAADFFTKPFRDQDILDAVALAAERKRLKKEGAKAADELRQRFQILSPRERLIMRLATSGLMNKQIAGELGLSEVTVKIHRGRIMRKMMARTFAELVRMADSVVPQSEIPLHQ